MSGFADFLDRGWDVFWYNIYYLLASIGWAVNRVILLGSVAIDSFANAVVDNIGDFIALVSEALSGPYALLLVLAIALYGLWYVGSQFTNRFPKPFEPSKTILILVVGTWFLGAPAATVSGIEAGRRDLGGFVQSAVSSVSYLDPNVFLDPSVRTGDDVVTPSGVGCDIRVSYPDSSCILTVATGYISVSSYDDISTAEFPPDFESEYFPNGTPENFNLSNPDERSEALAKAKTGVSRQFFGILGSITSVFDSILWFVLTFAGLVLWLQLPIAIALSPLGRMQGFFMQFIDGYVALIIETIMACVFMGAATGILVSLSQIGIGLYLFGLVVVLLLIFWLVSRAFSLASQSIKRAGNVATGASGAQGISAGKLAATAVGAAATGGLTVAAAGIVMGSELTPNRMRERYDAEGNLLDARPVGDRRAKVAGMIAGRSKRVGSALEFARDAKSLFGDEFSDPTLIDSAYNGMQLAKKGSNPFMTFALDERRRGNNFAYGGGFSGGGGRGGKGGGRRSLPAGEKDAPQYKVVDGQMRLVEPEAPDPAQEELTSADTLVKDWAGDLESQKEKGKIVRQGYKREGDLRTQREKAKAAIARNNAAREALFLDAMKPTRHIEDLPLEDIDEETRRLLGVKYKLESPLPDHIDIDRKDDMRPTQKRDALERMGERGLVDDVDDLLIAPTPRMLDNAMDKVDRNKVITSMNQREAKGLWQRVRLMRKQDGDDTPLEPLTQAEWEDGDRVKELYDEYSQRRDARGATTPPPPDAPPPPSSPDGSAPSSPPPTVPSSDTPVSSTPQATPIQQPAGAPVGDQQQTLFAQQTQLLQQQQAMIEQLKKDGDAQRDIMSQALETMQKTMTALPEMLKESVSGKDEDKDEDAVSQVLAEPQEVSVTVEGDDQLDDQPSLFSDDENSVTVDITVDADGVTTQVDGEELDDNALTGDAALVSESAPIGAQDISAQQNVVERDANSGDEEANGSLINTDELAPSGAVASNGISSNPLQSENEDEESSDKVETSDSGVAESEVADVESTQSQTEGADSGVVEGNVSEAESVDSGSIVADKDASESEVGVATDNQIQIDNTTDTEQGVVENMPDTTADEVEPVDPDSATIDESVVATDVQDQTENADSGVVESDVSVSDAVVSETEPVDSNSTIVDEDAVESEVGVATDNQIQIDNTTDAEQDAVEDNASEAVDMLGIGKAETIPAPEGADLGVVEGDISEATNSLDNTVDEVGLVDSNPTTSVESEAEMTTDNQGQVDNTVDAEQGVVESDVSVSDTAVSETEPVDSSSIVVDEDASESEVGMTTDNQSRVDNTTDAEQGVVEDDISEATNSLDNTADEVGLVDSSLTTSVESEARMTTDNQSRVDNTTDAEQGVVESDVSEATSVSDTTVSETEPVDSNSTIADEGASESEVGMTTDNQIRVEGTDSGVVESDASEATSVSDTTVSETEPVDSNSTIADVENEQEQTVVTGVQGQGNDLDVVESETVNAPVDDSSTIVVNETANPTPSIEDVSAPEAGVATNSEMVGVVESDMSETVNMPDTTVDSSSAVEVDNEQDQVVGSGAVDSKGIPTITIEDEQGQTGDRSVEVGQPVTDRTSDASANPEIEVATQQSSNEVNTTERLNSDNAQESVPTSIRQEQSTSDTGIVESEQAESGDVTTETSKDSAGEQTVESLTERKPSRDDDTPEQVETAPQRSADVAESQAGTAKLDQILDGLSETVKGDVEEITERVKGSILNENVGEGSTTRDALQEMVGTSDSSRQAAETTEIVREGQEVDSPKIDQLQEKMSDLSDEIAGVEAGIREVEEISQPTRFNDD